MRTPLQQTNKQTLTTSKHTFKNGDTDSLCHLKLNSDKSTWINRQWKCIILSLSSLIVFKENIVMIVMLQRLLGSPLNYLYLYANKTVWVKPLSLICITSLFYTIYTAKFFSVYGREDLAVNTVLNHSGSFCKHSFNSLKTMLFTSLGGSVLFILQKLTIMFSKLNELPIHLTINAPEFK